RGLQEARQQGARVALTDIQKLPVHHLESAETLAFALARAIAVQLGLDPPAKADWDPEDGWTVGFERFLRHHALSQRVEGVGLRVEGLRPVEGVGLRVEGPDRSIPQPSTLHPQPAKRLVWGLDEVDRLFGLAFASEVFGLFRAWHNERALLPE